MAGIPRRRRIVLGVWLLAMHRAAAMAAEITSIDELRKLSGEQSRQNLSVKVTGTIRFATAHEDFFCLSSGRNSVLVRFEDKLPAAVGDRVEVTGKTLRSSVAAEIMARKVEHLGTGDPPPDPFPLSGDLADIGHLHGQWTEIEGVVYRTQVRRRHDNIFLAGKDFGVRCVVSEPTELRPLDQLNGRRARIRGMCVLRHRDSEWIVDLHVPQSGVVSIGKGSADDKVPTLSISDWGSFDLTSHPHAIVQSRVQVTQSTGRSVHVFDETGKSAIQRDTWGQLQPGDVIYVRGVLQQRENDGRIVRAKVEKLGRGNPPGIVSVKADQARNHFNETIAVEGTLSALKHLEGGALRLLMHSDTTAFTVVVKAPVAGQFSETPLQPGSELRAVGVCWQGFAGQGAFQVVAQSVSVVSVVPAAQTVSIWPVGLTIASLVALTLTVVLIWLHRRQAAGQKLFYTQVHEQLDGMAHIARVNTLAEMVGALSHELSQPLASLSNFASAAQSLGDRVEDAPPQLVPIITRIKEEAHRANELIRRMRQLTRKQTSGREPADVDALVLEAVELFRFQGSAQMLIVDLDLHGNLPEVDLDLIQMEQVLLNLLNNARDATLGLEDRRPSITVRTSLQDGQVGITVEDNGTGMLEPTGGGAFEPYYTTKPEGTGLGLAISRTIVEAHGGTIVAEPNEPHGTLLRLTLSPAIAESVPKLAAG